MAEHILSGVLKDPNGDFSVGDQIRFTHISTTGETILSARSIFTVPPNGEYTIGLQFGLIRVEYWDIISKSWSLSGEVTINQDTLPTTLPGLLNTIVPVLPPVILEMEALVADAETAAADASDDADRAEAAADSIAVASGALVTTTSAQAIASGGAGAEIAFDSENYDDNDFHDNAVNNTRLTVPAGITRVRLACNINFDANSTGIRRVEIIKNGGTTSGGGVLRLTATPTDNTIFNVVSAPLKVVATDFFEVQVFQNSGGNLDVGSGNNVTWFAIEALE